MTQRRHLLQSLALGATLWTAMPWRAALAAPGAPAPREHIHHAGREYGIVLSGVLDVEIAGATTRVHAGDSIAFDSTLPHRFWNAGADPVRAIWFVRDRDSADPLPHG